MKKMLEEIDEIPEQAKAFLNQSINYSLPLRVPYLGMGSSYFAALAFKYMGIDIFPELASEYFFFNTKKVTNGVILSQSGRSSESLWCTSLFDSYIAISNDEKSPLCNKKNISKKILLHAGDEQYSSSKSYINTLLALFKGFGLKPENTINLINIKINFYKQIGEKIANQVFELISKNIIHGIYIIGSGPNIATAYEASLILSESTKRCFTGLPMTQYNHGPKETAKDSIVIQILSQGKTYNHAKNLTEKIINAGANVILFEESEVEENYSVLTNIIPFNYMAYYLALKLNITDTFIVGNKITEVL